MRLVCVLVVLLVVMGWAFGPARPLVERAREVVAEHLPSICDELGLRPVPILYMNYSNRLGECIVFPWGEVIVLYLGTMSRIDVPYEWLVLSTLRHEMRHVWQHRMGGLYSEVDAEIWSIYGGGDSPDRAY